MFFLNCMLLCMSVCMQALVSSETTTRVHQSHRQLGAAHQECQESNSGPLRAGCCLKQEVISAWTRFGSCLEKKGQGWREVLGDKEASCVAG